MLIKGLKTQKVDLFECHEALWDGIEDRVQTASGGWFSPRFWIRFISASYQLAKKHRHIPDYDVMLIGYPGAFDTFLGRVLSWSRRAPLVLDHYMSLYLIAEERGLFQISPISGLAIRLLEGLGLRLPDLLLSDTEDYIEYHQQLYKLKKKQFALVPAGADDKIFHPRSREKPPSDIFRMIYYGTFIPNHGIPAMIQAMDSVRDQKSVLLDMYGDGPEKRGAEKLAKGLGLTNVCFHDWVSREQLAKEIARSHLCLGAFGLTKQSMITVQNKIWESMAVGRPVITGDGPAICRELKHKESIYLVERMNPNALADGILELMSKPTLRESIARAGCMHAKKHSIASIGGISLDALLSLTNA